ncbi:MAG: DUF59 domain-containing protein [Candidatus Korarchaeota archaeon]|nr:DUF59 domain-containing protein [Candidatus Korarchaeota archaeon]
MTGEGDESAEIKQRVIKALKNVYDPEIPVNVYDLGLIYRIDVDERGNVELDMTLTSPGCPVAEMVLKMVEAAILDEIGIEKKVHINLVWDPLWTPDKVTPEGREKLKEVYGYDFVGEWLKKRGGR